MNAVQSEDAQTRRSEPRVLIESVRARMLGDYLVRFYVGSKQTIHFTIDSRVRVAMSLNLLKLIGHQEMTSEILS